MLDWPVIEFAMTHEYKENNEVLCLVPMLMTVMVLTIIKVQLVHHKKRHPS